MEIDYQKFIDFMLVSGHRLVIKAGNIADIGITKKDLTEEDLAIERGFKEIVTSFGSDHILYAEEENDVFHASSNLWVVDPISGTSTFINGLPHYSIVIAHLVNQTPVFAAVYDPAVDELFTAYAGKGAFLNGTQIKVSNTDHKLILRPSRAWKQPEVIERAKASLEGYEIKESHHSMAVDYCAVACGRADGVVSFTKDTFPEFAGSFMIKEAGGIFTNVHGSEQIQPTDRVFIGGNNGSYNKIFPLIKKAIG